MTSPTPLTPPVAEAVRARCEARAGWAQALLRRLVEIESPSTEPQRQLACLDVLATELDRLGFACRHLLGRTTGGQLYARPAPRSKAQPVQLLLGHADTVWPAGTLQSMPLVEREGRLHGPGVFDMKGGLTQMLLALDTLDALGLDPPATPVVFVNTDEEIGSFESMHWVERLARCAARTFVVEPALGLDGRLKTARKGVGKFRVVVQGRASHAGLDPEGGASAILELSHVIQALHALNDPARGISVNVGMIEGGQRPNVVAPESRAVVDVRVPTVEDARAIEDHILGLQAITPGALLSITGRVGRPPLERTPRNRRLWHQAKEAAALLGIPLDEGMAGGGSDGNTTSLYTATLDGLGAVGDGAHAIHEFAFLDRIPERAALLALLLLAPVDPPEPVSAVSVEDAAISPS
ncbi:MAG: M20 family metallopeptidase [Rhodothermaceae bacterium]|nr:M20 family metallopeptidase [Rhodothermaceae bacterium]